MVFPIKGPPLNDSLSPRPMRVVPDHIPRPRLAIEAGGDGSGRRTGESRQIPATRSAPEWPKAFDRVARTPRSLA